MGIDLFAYNKEAYIATTQMLTKKGKTAIMHPTGIGKSFISFNLREGHPDKMACRLSLSKYNRKTQTNNPLKAAEGYVRDGCPVDRLVFKSG